MSKIAKFLFINYQKLNFFCGTKPGSNLAKSGDFDSKFGKKWRFWVYMWGNCGGFETQICISVAPKVAIFEVKVGSFEKIKLETLRETHQ